MILAQEGALGCCQFGAIVATREQMAVTVCSHLHRGMSKPGLDDLQRQLEPAVDTAVDAPGGIEMPQTMQPGVLRLAGCCDDAGGNLDRNEFAIDDIGWLSIWPMPLGKTNPNSPFGQPSFHSFSVFDSMGASGMTRSPASDLRAPILL